MISFPTGAASTTPTASTCLASNPAMTLLPCEPMNCAVSDVFIVVFRRRAFSVCYPSTPAYEPEIKSRRPYSAAAIFVGR
jgi:hypothetical protein